MDIHTMVAVTEAYINHRTGKQIRINLNNINLTLLTSAYTTAMNWFTNNNGHIESITTH